INDFKIRYTDDKKDIIAIDNDFDLREAIKHIKSHSKEDSRFVVRLILEVTSFPTNQEHPNLSNYSNSDTNPSIAQNFVTQPNNMTEVSKSKSIHRHDDNHAFLSIPHPPTSYESTNSGKLGRNYHNAMCDYCKSVIVGIRHKCINCPDFDLCNACAALAPTQHPGHTFIPIHRTGEPEIKPSNSVFHPGIRCDACGKAIRGVRYKCGNCIDFDLCGNCEADPINKHDESHIFLKIKKPVLKRLRANKPLLHHLYSEANQTTIHAKYYRRYSQSRNGQNEFVASQTIPFTSSPDSSSSNQLNPLTSNGDTNSESVITRAPIGLYNSSLSNFNISPPKKLAQETVQTFISTNTSDIPCSPSPSVTTIASQD
ncbi:10729_t:CDS:1, partial [Cetraspora pellucida]